MKKFISIFSLVLLVLILNMIPAKADWQGTFGTGGTGSNWIHGALKMPCYTITILNDEVDQPWDDKELYATNRKNLINNYSKRYPGAPNKNWNTYLMLDWLEEMTYYSPSNIKNVGYYNYSSQEVEKYDESTSYRLINHLPRPQSNMPESVDRVREALRNKIMEKGLEWIGEEWTDNSGTIQQGRWGTAETAEMSYEDALATWCWIFSDPSTAQERLSQILYDDYYNVNPGAANEPSGKAYQQAGMIYLMSCVYYMNGDSEYKSYYAKRINTYCTDREATKKAPALVEIEAANCWVNQARETMVLNTVDALDNYMLARDNCSVRSKGWTPNHDFNTGSLLEHAGDWITANNPANGGALRWSNNKPGQANLMYNFGASLAFGFNFQTYEGGSGAWYCEVPGVSGYLKNIVYEEQMYGFFIAFNRQTVRDDESSGSQDISTNEPNLVELHNRLTTIGQDVTITLKSNTEADKLKSWVDKYGQKQPQFKIWAEIQRTGPTTSSPTPINELQNNSPITVSYSDLISFLKGEKTYDFKDITSNAPIGENQTIKFEYKSQVWIQEVDTTDPNNWMTLNPNDGYAEKSFHRKLKTPSYTSSPQYWSEIKNNEPENEEFEAMAGTPTTRKLYFATGGSEFIVDVDLEYVKDCTVSRNYTVKFSTDKCDKYHTVGCTAVSCPGHGKNKTDCGHHGCGRSTHMTCNEDHDVGGDSYSWSQNVNFDYMKIKRAKVWKIEKSKVDGMSKLTSAGNIITANIQKGDPNVFYNIAGSANNASEGRLVYSLEPNQGDNVTWNLPTSKVCGSWKSINEALVNSQYKTKTTNCTAVSDFLILQTTAGNQTVMYFDKASDTQQVGSGVTLQVPKTSEDEMWKNNSTSASQWEENHIVIGSYNGKFKSPDTKYKNVGDGDKQETIFDSNNFGSKVMSRPSEPDNQLLIYENFQPKERNINGLYKTGKSTVFYKNIINYDPDNEGSLYDLKTQSDYENEIGAVFETAYSANHSKVNNVVLHNPVSSQNAMVISLDNSRDQRTPESKPAVVPPKQDPTEYVNVLPDDYMNNILFNGDAELTTSKGNPLGWSLWKVSEGDIKSTTNSLQGKYSFTIQGEGVLLQEFSMGGNKTLNLTGNLKSSNNSGYFYANCYDDSGNKLSMPVGRPVGGKVDMTFTTPENTSKLRIHIAQNQGGNLIADDLVLHCTSNKGVFVPNNMKVYDYNSILNPAYHSHTESGCGNHVVYDCSNLPLNAGGSGVTKYKITHDGGCSYSGQTHISTNRNRCTQCGHNCGGDIIEFQEYNYHVHTSNCPQHLEWNCGLEDTSSEHSEDIEHVKYSQEGFEFNNNTEGFGCYNGSLTFNNGSLHGNVETSDFYCWSQGIDYDTSTVKYIELKLKNNSKGNSGQLYFLTNNFNHYSESTAIWFSTSIEDKDFKTYRIPVYNNANWKGRLEGIRLDLANGIDYGSFDLDYVRFISDYSVENKTTKKEPKYIEGWGLSSNQPKSRPDQKDYIQKVITPPDRTSIVTPSGKYTAGNFINLDYAFQIYFPNVGDFEGTKELGISKTTKNRGYGFINDMDTTEWTKKKYVVFQFDVLFEDKMYRAGSKVYLDVNKDTFDFYCPLENSEAIRAKVDFVAIANNNPYYVLDSEYPTNKIRYGNKLKADHSSIKSPYIDVVGRIGNMTMEDTGDFRFANFFKTSINDGNWLIPSLVPTVDTNLQNNILGDTKDIRGLDISKDTNILNTYGKEKFKEIVPKNFPLTPTLNNISSLQRQPLRIGYPMFMDVETIGNYSLGQTDILPYYYSMNLSTGNITPVDIYMSVNEQYQLINKFNKLDATGSVKTEGIYDNKVYLNWEDEQGRRNYDSNQETLTTSVRNYYNSFQLASVTGEEPENAMKYPYGKYYIMGNNNALALTPRCRTFNGTSYTYNVDKNPEDKVKEEQFGVQGQRWHFTVTLPSTAVAVKEGSVCNSDNINELRNNSNVLLCAVDIKAIGDKYALKHDTNNSNVPIQIVDSNGNPLPPKNYDLTSIRYKVIGVQSIEKSARDDLTTSGTH